jgi:hypothetical protein
MNPWPAKAVDCSDQRFNRLQKLKKARKGYTRMWKIIIKNFIGLWKALEAIDDYE